MYKFYQLLTKKLLFWRRNGNYSINLRYFRSSHQRCSVKKLFLKNSQNSQENTSARVSFLIKLQACQSLFFNKVSGLPATSLKKDSGTLFLQNTPGRLLLTILRLLTKSYTKGIFVNCFSMLLHVSGELFANSFNLFAKHQKSWSGFK